MTELRDEVARVIELALERHGVGPQCEGTLFDADAINPIVERNAFERAAIQVRDTMLENYSRHFEDGGEHHDGDAQIDCLMSGIRNLAPETTP